MKELQSLKINSLKQLKAIEKIHTLTINRSFKDYSLSPYESITREVDKNFNNNLIR